jgi:hypothetical protein
VTDPAARKAIYEKLAAKFLARRLDPLPLSPAIPDRAHQPAGRFKPMPDGLLRVTGVKLK